MHAMYSQTLNNTYTKMNLRTVKWAQWDKTQSRELLGLFICVCSSLCTIVAHNIAQNRPNNFPSCPPDNHHCSDDVYLREGGDYELACASKINRQQPPELVTNSRKWTDSWVLYPQPPATTKLTGFASISGTASGKSGVDMSTPWRHPCKAWCKRKQRGIKRQLTNSNRWTQ